MRKKDTLRCVVVVVVVEEYTPPQEMKPYDSDSDVHVACLLR